MTERSPDGAQATSGAAVPHFASLNAGYDYFYPRPMNERMWFGRIVAS